MGNTKKLFELQAQAANMCPHKATAMIVEYYRSTYATDPTWRLRAAHAVRACLKVSANIAATLVNEMSAEHKNTFDKY
jgi:hypothetical protein